MVAPTELQVQTSRRAMGKGNRKPERILSPMLPGIANVCRNMYVVNTPRVTNR